MGSAPTQGSRAERPPPGSLGTGHEASAQQALQKMAGVKMVHQVTGEHDIIAFIDAEPYAEFAMILSHIRTLDGIRDTDSHLVL